MKRGLLALAFVLCMAGCASEDRKGAPAYFNDRGEPVYLNKDGTPRREPPPFQEFKQPPGTGTLPALGN